MRTPLPCPGLQLERSHCQHAVTPGSFKPAFSSVYSDGPEQGQLLASMLAGKRRSAVQTQTRRRAGAAGQVIARNLPPSAMGGPVSRLCWSPSASPSDGHSPPGLGKAPHGVGLRPGVTSHSTSARFRGEDPPGGAPCPVGGSHPEFCKWTPWRSCRNADSGSVGLLWASDSAFLTSSQVRLKLLAPSHT